MGRKVIKEQLLTFNFLPSSSYLQATLEEAKGRTFPYKDIVERTKIHEGWVCWDLLCVVDT